jgi:hypothetical protein
MRKGSYKGQGLAVFGREIDAVAGGYTQWTETTSDLAPKASAVARSAVG